MSNVKEWIDKNEEFEGDQLFTPIHTREELTYVLKCFEQYIKDLNLIEADQWISVNTTTPVYGEPVQLRTKGLTQHITYIIDADEEETVSWFEPYFFDHDDDLKISLSADIEWRYIK